MGAEAVMSYRADLYATYVDNHFRQVRDFSPGGLERQARVFSHLGSEHDRGG